MSRTARIFVEGVVDEHVLRNLAALSGLDSVFDFEEQGGRTKLLRVFNVALKGSEIDRVGIVLDADETLDNQWAAVRGRLLDAGFSPQALRFDPKGFIVKAADLPVVGVWFMPDNSSAGALEEFAIGMIPEYDPLLPLARLAVESIPTQHRRFAPQHESKAVVHTWLAWQEQPGTKIGAAVSKGYFDNGQALALEFVSWLRALADA